MKRTATFLLALLCACLCTNELRSDEFGVMLQWIPRTAESVYCMSSDFERGGDSVPPRGEETFYRPLDVRAFGEKGITARSVTVMIDLPAYFILESIGRERVPKVVRLLYLDHENPAAAGALDDMEAAMPLRNPTQIGDVEVFEFDGLYYCRLRPNISLFASNIDFAAEVVRNSQVDPADGSLDHLAEPLRFGEHLENNLDSRRWGFWIYDLSRIERDRDPPRSEGATDETPGPVVTTPLQPRPPGAIGFAYWFEGESWWGILAAPSGEELNVFVETWIGNDDLQLDERRDLREGVALVRFSPSKESLEPFGLHDVDVERQKFRYRFDNLFQQAMIRRQSRPTADALRGTMRSNLPSITRPEQLP